MTVRPETSRGSRGVTRLERDQGVTNMMESYERGASVVFEVNVDGVTNVHLEFVPVVCLGEDGGSEGPRREATFWGVFHQEHQLVHGGSVDGRRVR